MIFIVLKLQIDAAGNCLILIKRIIKVRTPANQCLQLCAIGRIFISYSSNLVSYIFTTIKMHAGNIISSPLKLQTINLAIIEVFFP